MKLKEDERLALLSAMRGAMSYGTKMVKVNIGRLLSRGGTFSFGAVTGTLYMPTELGRRILSREDFSNGFFYDIHSVLMDGNVRKPGLIGSYLTEQNYIGKNDKSHAITFIPPEAKEVPALMSNLIDYINSPADSFQPLIRTAIIHIDKFREVIKQRIYAEEISHGEWDEEFDRCRQEELQIIIEDIPSAIEFLENECTADEYSWISEILEEIVEKTASREFIDCYKSLMNKFPEECQKYNIEGMIHIAEDMLNWREPHGKTS